MIGPRGIVIVCGYIMVTKTIGHINLFHPQTAALVANNKDIIACLFFSTFLAGNEYPYTRHSHLKSIVFPRLIIIAFKVMPDFDNIQVLKILLRKINASKFYFVPLWIITFGKALVPWALGNDRLSVFESNIKFQKIGRMAIWDIQIVYLCGKLH